VSTAALALTVVGAGLALWAAAIALTVWRLRRRNRVSPGTRTLAPLGWLWSPGRAARLHRRLRAAVHTARFRVTATSRRYLPASQVDDLVDELCRHATAIDDQLVLARRAPGPVRRRLLAEVETEVRTVEGLAGRIAATVNGCDRPGLVGGGPGLARLGERLDTLDAARLEIAELETAVGLDPAELHRPARRRPA
jgi:hypothetical protein